MAFLKRAKNWVGDRFGLTPLKRTALDRRVAKSPWYYGDGATLMLLLGVLVVTGMMMTLTYTPTPDGAYESVRYITYEQTLGWLIRALHYWSAGMMVVMVFWHVLRQILVAGYKFPREGTWLVGVVLFFAILVMSLTGYVLRWDERAIYALGVSLNMFARVPLIGEHLVIFILGGEEIGAQTLTRMYAVHVIFVPFLILGATAWHLYLVIMHGVTSKGEREELVHTAAQQKKMYKEQANHPEKGETFFPDTAFQSGLMAGTVFFIVLALAILAGPAPLMPEANLTEVAFPVEEWWWWWYSALIALLPSWVAPWFMVVFPLVLLLGMVLLPFIDRSPRRGMRKRPWAVALVCLIVIGIVGLSGLRLRSPWTGWPEPEPLPVPEGVELTPEAELGRQLFARYGCTSCHGVSGVGREVAVDLAQLRRPLSQAEFRSFILRPPEGVAMPAYEGRFADDEELERIIDYLMVAQNWRRER
jgi:ubiquinol-cytochrome c reductase cytochrome b subunit